MLAITVYTTAIVEATNFKEKNNLNPRVLFFLSANVYWKSRWMVFFKNTGPVVV